MLTAANSCQFGKASFFFGGANLTLSPGLSGATVASQWLHLIQQDIKGRLAGECCITGGLL